MIATKEIFIFGSKYQLCRPRLPYIFKIIAMIVFNTNRRAKHTKAVVYPYPAS